MSNNQVSATVVREGKKLAELSSVEPDRQQSDKVKSVLSLNSSTPTHQQALIYYYFRATVETIDIEAIGNEGRSAELICSAPLCGYNHFNLDPRSVKELRGAQEGETIELKVGDASLR